MSYDELLGLILAHQRDAKALARALIGRLRRQGWALVCGQRYRITRRGETELRLLDLEACERGLRAAARQAAREGWRRRRGSRAARRRHEVESTGARP